VKVITVRTTGFDAAATTGGSAVVETIDPAPDSGKSSFVGREVTKSDRPELTAAKIIVSGGRAMGSSDKFNDYALEADLFAAVPELVSRL
jgi:electron transfer flavoprotein alpha subunit